MFDCGSHIVKPKREEPPLDGVRKATIKDLPEVIALVQKAIRHMDDRGIHQWDELYPDEATLANDVQDAAMYLLAVGGELAAAFVLNRNCDPEYASGNWKGDASSFAVVHRLCVDPDFQRQGIGTRAMTAAEAIARSGGAASIRLDAFSKNPAALRLYERLGYSKAGMVRFRKGLFFLYEKML